MSTRLPRLWVLERPTWCQEARGRTGPSVSPGTGRGLGSPRPHGSFGPEQSALRCGGEDGPLPRPGGRAQDAAADPTWGLGSPRGAQLCLPTRYPHSCLLVSLGKLSFPILIQGFLFWPQCQARPGTAMRPRQPKRPPKDFHRAVRMGKLSPLWGAGWGRCADPTVVPSFPHHEACLW